MYKVARTAGAALGALASDGAAGHTNAVAGGLDATGLTGGDGVARAAVAALEDDDREGAGITGGTGDTGIAGVTRAAVAALEDGGWLDLAGGGDGDEVEAEGLVEEGGGAVVLLEVAVAGGDLVVEVVLGEGVAGLEDVVDDVAEGVVVDACGAGCRWGVYLAGEVVGADGESELGVFGVVSHVVAVGVSDGGDVALGGDGEDVVGAGE